MHRIVITLYKLFLYKIKQSGRCKYREGEKEDIDHTYLECNKNELFWEKLEQGIEWKENFKLQLCEKTIILGWEEIGKREDRVHIILVLAKYYLYVQRMKEKRIHVNICKFYWKIYLLKIQFIAGYENKKEQFDSQRQDSL